MKPKLFIRSVS